VNHPVSGFVDGQEIVVFEYEAPAQGPDPRARAGEGCGPVRFSHP
jgi:hypothetical protein